MRVSVGGPCHRNMGMRGMLWECSQCGGEGGVNMSVVVAGVQFHCGMCCWYIYVVGKANKPSQEPLCSSKCCPQLMPWYEWSVFCFTACLRALNQATWFSMRMSSELKLFPQCSIMWWSETRQCIWPVAIITGICFHQSQLKQRSFTLNLFRFC